MIKLKKLIKENVWDRKFGEPLPTLKDIAVKHYLKDKEKQKLTEGIDLHSHVVLVKNQLERFNSIYLQYNVENKTKHYKKKQGQKK